MPWFFHFGLLDHCPLTTFITNNCCDCDILKDMALYFCIDGVRSPSVPGPGVHPRFTTARMLSKHLGKHNTRLADDSPRRIVEMAYKHHPLLSCTSVSVRVYASMCNGKRRTQLHRAAKCGTQRYALPAGKPAFRVFSDRRVAYVA